MRGTHSLEIADYEVRLQDTNKQAETDKKLGVNPLLARDKSIYTVALQLTHIHGNASKHCLITASVLPSPSNISFVLYWVYIPSLTYCYLEELTS